MCVCVCVGVGVNIDIALWCVDVHPKSEKKNKKCAKAICECLQGRNNESGESAIAIVPSIPHVYKLVEVSKGLGNKMLPQEQCEKVATLAC